MIDNIVLRLHGCNQPRLDTQNHINAYKKGIAVTYVPAHFDLYKKILQYKGKGFTISKIFNRQSSEISEKSEEEYLLTKTSKKLNEHYLSLDKISFVSDKVVKERNLKVNGNYRVPSSEHNVVFSVNIDAGYVEFNINVPKYLYGHNLAQFIPQVHSNLFRSFKGDFNQWSVQKSYLHDRIYGFLDAFFTDLLFHFQLEMMPDYDYIELNRIDLCYNQFFNTKDDALMYLNEQKKIHKKRSRLKNKVVGDYETSISFHTTNGSYFKIYHKGSEYINVKHGDFKKHEAINKTHIRNKKKYHQDPVFKNHNDMIFKMFKNDTLGELFDYPEELKPIIKNTVNDIYNDMPINTMFLKREMDKVLRYEISISSKSLSRIYKDKVFRANCKYHTEAKRIYKAVRRYDKRKNKKSKHRPTTDDRNTFKEMSRFLNNGCFLLLSQNQKYHKYAKNGSFDYNSLNGKYRVKRLYEFLKKGSLLETRDIGFFSKPFLNLLVNDFYKQIQHYQVEELKPFDDLVKLVKEYNSRVEDNLVKYNATNDYKTWKTVTEYDVNGRSYKKNVRITKGNKIITKASQLLTEKQKRELDLQAINITNVLEIFRLMHDEKMSPSQIREYLKLSKSSFHRRMSYLKILGVKEQTLSIPKPINVRTDFQEYYYLTSGLKYRKNFYLEKSHVLINDKPIKRTFK